MLSVSVQQDIGEIQPKVVGSLTGRNLVCSIAAIGISILVSGYCYFLLHLGIEVCLFIIILLSMPIWAIGFWHPYNMNFEDFFPIWAKFMFGKNFVPYISSDNLDGYDWTQPPKLKTLEREKLLGSKIDKTYELITKRPDAEAINLNINKGFDVKNNTNATCANPFGNNPQLDDFKKMQDDFNKYVETEKKYGKNTEITNSGKLKNISLQKENQNVSLGNNLDIAMTNEVLLKNLPSVNPEDYEKIIN